MKIASFNVQRFGRSKVSDPNVLNILVKIISRYDIIVILEVVDISGESVETLMEALNKSNRKHHYTLKISSRLGRTNYKEQFMFLYRDDLVDLVGSFQFDDEEMEGMDVFARDPYILRFRCLSTVLKDLVLIPVHTKPEDSDKELDELYDVFLHIKKRWMTDNVMILGDFNADGAYVTKRDMKSIRIRSDKNFHWLIGDDVDTTANTGNDHTYDRIVVYGDDMLRALVPSSAKPFNFQEAYGLSNEQALDVSDHYPVEVELKSLPEMQVQPHDARYKSAEVAVMGQDLLELKRGNLLLEREKLNLEIQLLRLKVDRINGGSPG
ncbi:deoxyribonuclease-1-like isoform X1 [Cololabis saira]|uniref:deoxyribonuclease-1-like isoform X1 n=1 Tax=Cololabis saira TaxID=129043 RepID=UPI002AD505C4|nr:deoxyribonuclease-1-like isoform X1 [Cololabis saira]XP_061582620.1 deoxyribonuclease-1-like isoform X1 [Cololabis saira]XP_061582666.1 deoxyribonuclease-1-like isoform X1 [Cololabis saira]XP_061582667.1 deoxyribonuclease-1-like isoform X1 [Cololabis saira]